MLWDSWESLPKQFHLILLVTFQALLAFQSDLLEWQHMGNQESFRYGSNALS